MDLEQYGVWVKAGPEDVADDSEEMFALSDVGDDVDESTFLQRNDLTAEEEDLLASLEEEPQPDSRSDAGSVEPVSVAAADSDDFSLDDLDDFSLEDMSIPGDEGDSTSLDDLAAEFDVDDSAEDLPELDLEDEGGFDDMSSFDDVNAVTEAMTDPFVDRSLPSTAGAGAAAAAPQGVAGIESELASIKAELQALRRDLSEMRSRGLPAGKRAQSQLRDSEEPEVTAGFFEEDEDETIALTDDELDNILNTAEFTEELGKPSEVDEVEVDAAADDSLDLQSSDLPDGDAFDSILGTESPDTPEPETPQPQSSQAPAAHEEWPAATQADAESEQPTAAAVDEIFLEELDDEEMLGATGSLEEASAHEDESLHQGDFLAPSVEDEEITFEDDAVPEEEIGVGADSGEEDPASGLFIGTNEDIDTLAAIDIDTELAEIDEMRAEEVEPAEDLDSLDSIEIDVIGPEGHSDALLDEQDDEAAEVEEPDDLELNLDDIDQDDTLTLDEETPLTPTFHAAEADEEDDELGIDLNSGPEEPSAPSATRSESFPSDLREEIRSVLQYMDQLLESLPEEKIEEFARSEHFEVYKRLFEELGLDSPSAT